MPYQNRKLNRLQQYDYSAPGYYFVTIVVQDRACCLGEVVDGKMVLNEYGKIAERQWLWLKENFLYIDLDTYQIMPNHIHGIIIIRDSHRGSVAVVGNGLDRSKLVDIRTGQAGVPQKSPGEFGVEFPSLRNINPLPLSNIVSAFKTLSSKFIHLAGNITFSWQKSFYDHVIRADESLDKIREYILNNPKQWELDAENPNNKK